ncbi:hypothetical protein M9458_056782, partial [Cirrhinus mrigala]
MAFTFSKQVLADVLSWACIGSIILVWYVRMCNKQQGLHAKGIQLLKLEQR